MLYIFDELESLKDDFLERCEPLLSIQRLEKVKKFKNKDSKIQSAAVFLLLRFALYHEFDIDEAPEFVYNDNGKPSLKDYPEIHFNLSHCKTAVACALSNEEVGVDIQDVKPVKDNLIKRVLTEQEFNVMLRREHSSVMFSHGTKPAPEHYRETLSPTQTITPDEYFSKLWTIKESIIKKTGQGIGDILTGINSESIDDITVINNKNYYCSVTMKDAKIIYVQQKEILRLTLGVV